MIEIQYHSELYTLEAIHFPLNQEMFKSTMKSIPFFTDQLVRVRRELFNDYHQDLEDSLPIAAARGTGCDCLQDPVIPSRRL
jgi:hypothetical protein